MSHTYLLMQFFFFGIPVIFNSFISTYFWWNIDNNISEYCGILKMYYFSPIKLSIYWKLDWIPRIDVVILRNSYISCVKNVIIDTKLPKLFFLDESFSDIIFQRHYKIYPLLGTFFFM